MSSKRMTAREKKQRAAIKRELQDKGILPPDKPKLNRKKYKEEALQEWNERDGECLLWSYWLREAIGYTIGLTDRNLHVSAEAIGVAKTLKLAIRLKEFSDKLKEEGRTEYKIGEQYEYIKDILDA